MPLCESCRNFDIHCFSTDPDGIRAYKLQAVIKAAGERFGFCVLLLTNLKNDIALFQHAEVEYSWIQMSLYDNFKSTRKDGKGYRYNKFIAKLATRSIPRLAIRVIDKGGNSMDSGKQCEFSVAADQGKLPPLKKNSH